MRDEQIAAIRAACIKANPEIEKEWSDCKVCSGVGFTAEHEGGQACYEGECNNCPVQVQCDPCMGSGKVLGRPIRLADVLLAIREIKRPIAQAMVNTWWDRQERKLLETYDLMHDNLTAQSDETLSFLAKLLDA